MEDTKYNISEIFASIQGEGKQLGMIATFIRLAGCSLKCSWCDSKYAFTGDDMSLDEIMKEVNQLGDSNIVLTGGEVLEQDVLPLFKALGKCNKKIYVETNGTIFKPELIGYAKFVVSPKPQFMTEQYETSLLKWAIHATFKFVVDDEYDFDVAVKLARKLNIRNSIYLMPQCIDDDTMKQKLLWLTEKVKEEIKGSDVDLRVTPRLQIYLYGNVRGK